MKPDPIQVLRDIYASANKCPYCGYKRNEDGSARHKPGCDLATCLALPQSEEPARRLVETQTYEATCSVCGTEHVTLSRNVPPGSFCPTCSIATQDRVGVLSWDLRPEPSAQPVPASSDRVRVTDEMVDKGWAEIVGGDMPKCDWAEVTRDDLRQTLEAALSVAPEQGRVEELERENAELRNRLHELDPAIRAYRILGDPSVAVTSAPRATTDHDGGADV